MPVPTFSVCLIARNEAKTLPRLAASLEEFKGRGGELILVDTNSTDGTADIARSLGFFVVEVRDRFRKVIDAETAKAINDKFVMNGEAPIVSAGDSLFDFSAARNFAASLAKNDMIAMPDCDEEYTKLDLDAIEETIKQGAEQLEYEFVFSHDAQGLPLIAFKHCKFYNRERLSWTGIIHEVLTGEAKRVYLPESVIKLEHFQNHETNRTGYLKGLALDCYLNPDNDRNAHYFARELYYTERYRSAIQAFTKHISMNKWPAERSQSYIFVGNCWERLGEEAAAVCSWQAAFTVEAGRRAPLIRLAEHYQSKNDPQRAAAYALASLSIKQGNFYSDEAPHYRNVPHEILYWAAWYLGNKEESLKHFKKAQAFTPNSSKILHDQRFYEDLPKISIVLPTLGKRPEGLERVKRSVEALIYPKEKLELLIEDGEGTVPAKVAKLYARATGDYIVFASDDIEFTPESLMIALNYSRERNKQLVAFHVGDVLPDEGNICEHFLIKRELIETLGGEIFDTRYHHVGVDNLLYARAKKIDQAAHCNEAKINHYHFSRGAVFDETYQKGWAKAEEDRARLKEDLLALNL